MYVIPCHIKLSDMMSLTRLFLYFQPLIIAILSTVLGGAYALYRKATRISVAHVRGPPAETFTLGEYPGKNGVEMFVAEGLM